MIAPAMTQQERDALELTTELSQEAAALAESHGLTIAEACEVVGLDLAAYAPDWRRKPPPFIPTPDDIAEAAEAIRATWGRGEAERRLVGRADDRWAVPTVATG